MRSYKHIPVQFTVVLYLLIYLSACNRVVQNDSTNNDTDITNSTAPCDSCDANDISIDKNIRSIFQDRHGNYWFGTNGAGVYRYDTKAWTQFTVKEGLADNQVVFIQEDELGNLWFESGSFRISKYDGKTFTTQTSRINATKGSPADWESKDNNLWFYAGAGVFRYNNSTMDYLPFVVTPSRAPSRIPFTLSRFGVYSILKDKKGNSWFGTQAEGVCKYDGKTLTWFKGKGLAGPAVLAVFEDSKGNLWFGNNGAGLFLFDGDTLVNITEEKGLGHADARASENTGLRTLTRVYSINEDNNGNIWIGTVDAGVWMYDGRKYINYTTKEGLSSNAVNTIYKDNSGELWFGTDSNGLCKFNGTSFIPWPCPKASP